jgi:8-oxo-dGTP diphosphatase
MPRARGPPPANLTPAVACRVDGQGCLYYPVPIAHDPGNGLTANPIWKVCMSNSAWPRCGASAVIFRGPEVLLVERGKAPLIGLWSLPGGHIEAGETARAAALREVREETGVEAEIGGLIDIHEVIRRDEDGALAAHYLLAVFVGRWLGGAPVPGDDVTRARFVALDTVAGLPLTDGALSFIHRAETLRKHAG